MKLVQQMRVLLLLCSNENSKYKSGCQPGNPLQIISPKLLREIFPPPQAIWLQTDHSNLAIQGPCTGPYTDVAQLVTHTAWILLLLRRPSCCCCWKWRSSTLENYLGLPHLNRPPPQPNQSAIWSFLCGSCAFPSGINRPHAAASPELESPSEFTYVAPSLSLHPF